MIVRKDETVKPSALLAPEVDLGIIQINTSQNSIPFHYHYQHRCVIGTMAKNRWGFDGQLEVLNFV